MNRKNLYQTFVMCFLLGLQGHSLLGQIGKHSATLESFWSGIKKTWLPVKENEVWTSKQRNVIRKYCKNFATQSSPRAIVPAMVEDLKQRPSEVNAFIYTWVMLNWKHEKVKALLMVFYESKDPIEKQIASDFIAEMEEGEKAAEKE